MGRKQTTKYAPHCPRRPSQRGGRLGHFLDRFRPTIPAGPCAGLNPDHLSGAARCCVPFWVGGSGKPAPARPRAGARCGTAYPSGGPGSYEASGRSAPLPRLPGRGSPFLPRNGEKEGRGPLSSVGSSVGTIAGWTLQRGFPPTPAGPDFLWRKSEEEHQGSALDPVLWPLVPTRWFLGSLSLTR